MKYLSKIAFGLIVFAGIMSSCKDDDNNGGVTAFSLDRDDVTMGADGGTDVVQITAGDEWVAQSSEPWVSVTPANGTGSAECTIVVDSTLINDMRTAEIRFIPKGQPMQKLTVHQTGYGKGIYVQDSIVEVKASETLEKRYFEAVVTTNVSFKVSVDCLKFTVVDENGNESEVTPDAAWLETHDKNPTIELDRGARPRTDKIRFDWKTNPNWGKRIAKVHFVPLTESGAVDTESATTILTVSQEAAPVITDNRAGDSLAILAIRERLDMMNTLDASENMRNWSDVKLWEKTDEDLPEAAAVGRVRSVSFSMFRMKETIPQEVKYLKYLESLSFYSNVNTMLLSIDLGSDVCELNYLKYLQIGAYGLVSLPDDFWKLGKTLETLDLDANNFDHIPDVLTPGNFPHLKSLNLIANRRWGSVSNLQTDNNRENGLGFHLNFNTNQNGEINAFKRLLMWEELEELSLSYNYMEGNLPELNLGDVVNMGDRHTDPTKPATRTVESYNADDLKAYGDTVQYLLTSEGQQIPKILPNAKIFSINLNFLTGNLPDWILYHPHFLDWDPEVFIFNQMENGIDSEGKKVKFDNEPTNFEYYYSVYPKYREKYEFKETTDEE